MLFLKTRLHQQWVQKPPIKSRREGQASVVRAPQERSIMPPPWGPLH